MSNSWQPRQPTSPESSERDSSRWVAGIFYINPENVVDPF